jgi:hypothetical protein
MQGVGVNLMSIPFGATSPDSMASLDIPGNSYGPAYVLQLVLIINTPQLILSIMYVIYNGVYTSICGSIEWSSFRLKRKGIRVSGHQQGRQRSTYFLQIPYRFSLPIMLIFATLHLLVSQSFFLVWVEEYAYSFPGARELRDMGSEYSSGFSAVALLVTILVGLVPLVWIIILGQSKLDPDMPVAGSCSAAIAAACQPGNQEEGELAALSEVQWGVMETDNPMVGHCGFSMHPVSSPELGKAYA